MTSKSLDIINIHGIRENCQISFTSEEPWLITFNSLTIDAQKFTGNDLFECLRGLRQYLELQGSLLLCNGARIDIYPSGISRETTGGRKAYILTIGQRTSKSDLVDIFDQTESTRIGSVRDQEIYYQGWLKSLGIYDI